MPRIIIKNPPRGPGQNTPVVCRVTLDIYIYISRLRSCPPYIGSGDGRAQSSDQSQTRMSEVSGSRGLRLLLFSGSRDLRLSRSPAPEVSGSYCSPSPIVLRLPRSPALEVSGSRGLRLLFSERGGPYIIFITARQAISTLI